MIELSISVNRAQRSRLKRELASVRNGVPRAIASAVRRTTGTVKTSMNREIRKTLNLKAADVRSDLDSRVTGTGDDTHGVIRVSSKPHTLRAFGAREARGRGRGGKSQGVKVRVFKTKPATVIKRGFTPAKFKGVPFKRTGKRRVPIEPMFGPSLAGFLSASGKPIFRKIQRDAEKALQKNLESQTNRLLKRAK